MALLMAAGLVAMGGSAQGQKPTVDTTPASSEREMLERHHPELRRARERWTRTQADLARQRREVSDRIFAAQQKLEAIVTQQAEVKEKRLALDLNRDEGWEETKLQLAQLAAQRLQAEFELDGLSEMLRNQVDASNPTRRKTLPPMRFLLLLKEGLNRDMDLDLSELEPRDAKASNLFDIIDKRYRLGFFTHHHSDGNLSVVPPSGWISVAGFTQSIDDSLESETLVVRDYGITIIPKARVTADILTYREFRRYYLPLLTD
jgi:hypothetical protein